MERKKVKMKLKHRGANKTQMNPEPANACVVPEKLLADSNELFLEVRDFGRHCFQISCQL
jgi:hypothetical protein